MSNEVTETNIQVFFYFFLFFSETEKGSAHPQRLQHA